MNNGIHQLFPKPQGGYFHAQKHSCHYYQNCVKPSMSRFFLARPNSSRPILERLLRNYRIPFVDEQPTSEQVDIRPRKPGTSHFSTWHSSLWTALRKGASLPLHLTNSQQLMAQSTNRIIAMKLFKMTKNVWLIKLQNLLSSIRFFVGRRQKNGLSQGSVLSPLLY